MPKKRKIDRSKLVIPPWAKPERLVWVELRDKDDIQPEEYKMGVITEVDADKKTIGIKYEGDAGPADPDCDRVHERAETP